MPVHAELTTKEADLLNVSRPTLIQILEQGQIPFRKVGTHRRILFAKAMEYKRKLESDHKAALAELVAYDQKIGLGLMPPFTAFLDANVPYPAELRSFLMFRAVPGDPSRALV